MNPTSSSFRVQNSKPVPTTILFQRTGRSLSWRSSRRTTPVLIGWEKLRAYACAPVPLYLLVDRFDEAGPAVTLFSDPVDGHYRESKQVSFGEPIALPAPVELKLETADFA